jgi:hypothetical protein
MLTFERTGFSQSMELTYVKDDVIKTIAFFHSDNKLAVEYEYAVSN